MTRRNPIWLRAAGAIWVLAFLIWLPFEDTEVWWSLALAAVGCMWLGLRWIAAGRWPKGVLGGLAAGTLLGAFTPLFAIVLMGFKGGLHGHGFSDFTARQIWEVLNLIPIGVVAGVVLGLASLGLNRNRFS